MAKRRVARGREEIREPWREPMALSDSNRQLRAQASERRAAEEMFRGLFESAPDAMVISREDGRIFLVNAQTEQLFGYARDELIGQPVEILIPERFRAGHVGHRAHYAVDPRTRPMGAGGLALFGRRRDGSEFPAAISLSPVRTREGVLVFTDIRDISAQQQTERRIRELNESLARRNAELEALNRELEAFSYSVSHDLRAPLRSIDGFSQALIEDYGDRLDAPAREFLQRVRAAAQRMAVLIDDLLKLARVTRTGLKLEEVDLSALAREVAAELREHDPDRPVELAIAPDLRATADPRLVRLVLENLLGNAWKFTRGRAPARIEFSAVTRDDSTAYCVRDNGAGFDMGYAGKLFGAFQRLHNASDYPGTGIGLATVQRIVHKHGGEVWAEGAVGQGASFCFTLRGGRS
jgi:PAS domain S-box-containing protein